MPLPKYHQVYLVLKQRLTGVPPGGMLPGELDLAEEFSFSRVTIRRALSQLSGEGLIERSAGRGTRRVDVRPPDQVDKRPGLLESIVSNTRNTSVKVLALERVPAAEPVAAALRIAMGTRLLRVVSVRSTADGPVSYIETWVQKLHAAKLTRRRLESNTILALLEESGTQIAHAIQTVTARQADRMVATHLQVSVGQALLSVHRLVFDASGNPVLWLQGLYRPDRYEYEMKLSRSDSGDAARIWLSAEHPTRVS